MNGLRLVTAVIALSLAFFSTASFAQNCTTGGSQSSFRLLQRDRMNELPRSEVASRITISQDLFAETNHPEIYGRKLMSDRELKRYLKKVDTLADDPEKLAAYLAKHREKMLSRAQKKGVDASLLEAKVLQVSP